MQSEAHGRANEEWREVARRIQKENDPEKMVELVHELLAKFDEEKLRRSPRPSVG
jgi:anti-sigma-K factor RskA